MSLTPQGSVLKAARVPPDGFRGVRQVSAPPVAVTRRAWGLVGLLFLAGCVTPKAAQVVPVALSEAPRLLHVVETVETVTTHHYRLAYLADCQPMESEESIEGYALWRVLNQEKNSPYPAEQVVGIPDEATLVAPCTWAHTTHRQQEL